MSQVEGIKVREYGRSEPTVIVLHGVPGAPGHAGPLARGLGDEQEN